MSTFFVPSMEIRMSSCLPELRLIIHARTTIVIVIIFVTALLMLAGAETVTVAVLLSVSSAVAIRVADQTVRPARR